jgi:alcohol dehydrogenase class IV
MVSDFNLYRIPRILFGNGKLSQLPQAAGAFGNTILVITGKNSFENSRHAADLKKILQKDFKCYYESVESEPSPLLIDKLADRYAGLSIKVVVAIGGGSVMDAGKAVSAMLLLQKPVKEYLEGVGNQSHPGIKIPFIAVPTTAGTGSETTFNAVLSETGIHGFKRSLRHENFIPDVAIVDPGLTYSCSPEQTSLSGMDAFTQLLESYFSAKGNSFTDALAMEGIRNVRQFLKKATETGDDPEARAGMSYAAMLSGITLTNAGLGLVHGFASSIGGLIQIPHGLICGTLMGAANRLAVEKLLKANNMSVPLLKYIRLGKILSEEEGRSDEDYAFWVANYLESLTLDLKIPLMGKFGLTEMDAERIAEITDHKNNPVVFHPEELKAILMSRI